MCLFFFCFFFSWIFKPPKCLTCASLTLLFLWSLQIKNSQEHQRRSTEYSLRRKIHQLNRDKETLTWAKHRVSGLGAQPFTPSNFHWTLFYWFFWPSSILRWSRRLLIWQNMCRNWKVRLETASAIGIRPTTAWTSSTWDMISTVAR